MVLGARPGVSSQIREGGRCRGAEEGSPVCPFRGRETQPLSVVVVTGPVGRSPTACAPTLPFLFTELVPTCLQGLSGCRVLTGDSLAPLILWGDTNGSVPRSVSTRADLENNGLDRQLGDLSDCPDHVHHLEGQPGPQTGELLAFPSPWFGNGCPCDCF